MSQVSEDTIETPYGWVIMAASLLIITMAVATNYLVVVGIKPMAEDLDWPRWVTSSAYSCMAIGSGVGGILVGLWADKRGIASALALAGGLHQHWHHPDQPDEQPGGDAGHLLCLFGDVWQWRGFFTADCQCYQVV